MIIINRKHVGYSCLVVIGLAGSSGLTGCAEAFEKDLSSKTTVLMAPSNNITSDTSATFAWQRLDDAKRYELQVVSPQFDSIIYFIADTTVKVNFFNITLAKGQYQWRVRSLNASSATPFSDPWNLTVQ